MSDKITNELILEEIRKSRQELKAAIEAVEARISKKIEETKHQVNEIKQQCENLSARIELLEIREKENNIVIFGLQKGRNQITAEEIINDIQKYLNINLQISDINNLYPLGNSDNCPIKLELISYLKKKLILENVRNLKGTNIFITNDLTIKQRKENKILRKHLHIAKQDTHNICYIKRNKLYINNKAYTSQELEELEALKDNNPQIESNSAPGTPTTSSVNVQRELQEPHQRTQKELTFSIPTGLSKKKKDTKEDANKLEKEAIKEDKITTRSKNIK